jgi:hypothetical protein
VIHDDNPPLVTVISVQVGTIQLGTGKKARKTTGLVIQLSGPVNPAQAQGLAEYRLLAGTVRKGRTTYNRNVPLSSAGYNPATRVVSLAPRGKLNPAQPEQLRITASLLTDTLGRPIDGNRDGLPGGDLVANIKGKAVTLIAASAAKVSSASGLALEAIDRVLAGDPQLVAGSLGSTPSEPKPHGAAHKSQGVKVASPASRMVVGQPGWSRRAMTMTRRLSHEVAR